MAVSRIFCATGLIGGLDGDLDTIDGQNLADKDMAIAIDQTTVYFYALDADSAGVADGINIITPLLNAGDKRWILQSLYANDLTLSDDIILVTDEVNVGTKLTIGDTEFTDGVITDATGLSLAGDVDCTGAHSATTYDADTDFTVGGTVITDGQITDNGVFYIDATTRVEFRGGDDVRIGVNDSAFGALRCYGSNTSQGGQLLLYNAGDETQDYYVFESISGNLSIGPNGDNDALQFVEATMDWHFNAAVDVDAAFSANTIDGIIGSVTPASIVGTTIDANTDFTVGGTVITDNTITDDGTLILDAATEVAIKGQTHILSIGDNDADTRGTINLYGGTGANAGGTVRIYIEAEHDDPINYYQMYAFEDHLYLGPDTDSDALKYDGGTNTWIFTAGNTEVQLLTKLRMGDAIQHEWDSVPASDATMSGDTSQETVDANASGIGACLVLSADGNWDEADASAVATVGQLGIAVEASTGTKYILWNGWVKDTAWTWTPGAQLFVSETTGAITATAPSTSGAFVQVVGYATSATTIRFNPSPDYLEVA